MAIGVNTNYKFVKVNTETNKVYKFNDHNRWVYLCDLADLTLALINANGINYTKLNTSYTKIYLDYTEVETLSDGSVVYESEEINVTMGVTALSEETLNSKDVLGATVASFTPKDKLDTNEILYAGTTSTLAPNLESVSFTPSNIHKGVITVNISSVCNYDTPVKARYKINSGEYSAWGETFNPYNATNIAINSSEFKVGSNNITIQVAKADTESSYVENVSSSAINVVNNNPTILVINYSSDAHRIVFTISDADNDDKVRYRILMNDNVEKDWSDFKTQPVNVNYAFSDEFINIGHNNTLKIEYQDEFQTGTFNTTYQFEGAYKNLVFLDADGNYLSDDKGNVITLLDFGEIVAGTETEVRKITVKNCSSVALTNLTIVTNYINSIEGAKVLYSKGDLPFNNLDSLNYGNTVLEVNDTIDFYIKVDAELEAKGRCIFDMIVSADKIN